ncbi:hypothetical protein HN695_06480 [Candidatus Woesearchaeota archaeon]|jgi:hypothetical protein|nr:hypothetical protein [Candidatus Woesearchaeota archaeon]MBT5272096.1 hypothetical protein [Candidatus Woesearchaeota archaeon]MBT6041846.1 hypothetical protein [Candidatus Woesearchaeota archaeon]MBT6336779.1 hypothetical protein [Candidatus Woesearchaeota archaeon]MBT7927953.1 hypothetical protein [Candidatus Woesearchaeota archaeon]
MSYTKYAIQDKYHKTYQRYHRPKREKDSFLVNAFFIGAAALALLIEIPIRFKILSIVLLVILYWIVRAATFE